MACQANRSRQPSRCPPAFKNLSTGSASHQRIKVFWFFSSEKNKKESSFSEEKEAKRLLGRCAAGAAWRVEGFSEGFGGVRNL
jgi:hypothetical protein